MITIHTGLVFWTASRSHFQQYPPFGSSCWCRYQRPSLFFCSHSFRFRSRLLSSNFQPQPRLRSRIAHVVLVLSLAWVSFVFAPEVDFSLALRFNCSLLPLSLLVSISLSALLSSSS